jgi:anaerobic selenocysteine-containing dehydrogenase
MITKKCDSCRCQSHHTHRQCFCLAREGATNESDPNSTNGAALCAKGQATVRNLYSPERLNYPMKRSPPKRDPDPGWVHIAWEEALTTIAATLKEIKGKYGAHAIAMGQGTGRYAEEHNVRLKNTLSTPDCCARPTTRPTCYFPKLAPSLRRASSCAGSRGGARQDNSCNGPLVTISTRKNGQEFRNTELFH